MRACVAGEPDNKLNEYRFTEIQCDFREVKARLTDMDKVLNKTLQKFGERIGKCESRVETLYWLIPLSVAFTGVIVGAATLVLGGG